MSDSLYRRFLSGLFEHQLRLHRIHAIAQNRCRLTDRLRGNFFVLVANTKRYRIAFIVRRARGSRSPQWELLRDWPILIFKTESNELTSPERTMWSNGS